MSPTLKNSLILNVGGNYVFFPGSGLKKLPDEGIGENFPFRNKLMHPKKKLILKTVSLINMSVRERSEPFFFFFFDSLLQLFEMFYLKSCY